MLRGGFLLVMMLQGLGLFAQYPDVHEEPFHTPILTFGGLRYLRVEASQGDTTSLHFHRNPICYLTVSGTEVWLDETNGKSRTATIPTGWIGSDFYESGTPFLHRFAVIDSMPLLLIGVEKTGAGEPILLPKISPVYASDEFLVFEMPYESFQLMDLAGYPAIVSAGVLVAPSGEKRGPGTLIFADGEYRTEENTVVWVVIPQ